jgi:hypothetical protein
MLSLVMQKCYRLLILGEVIAMTKPTEIMKLKRITIIY